MNLISFLGKRFKRFFSSGQKVPTSKFRWLILMGVLCFVPWQEAEAASGCSWSTYKDKDEVTWDAERGVIHYRIRACQTWGGQGNARCAWGGDHSTGLYLTQNTATKRTIHIKCDMEYNDNGSKLDNNNLIYKWDDEDAPGAQGGSDETTWYMVFDVPVEQSDLGKTITIDMDGYWWKKGGSGEGVDETYAQKSYKSVTLSYPSDPGLKITKTYYDCSKDAKGNPLHPMISFNWSQSDDSNIRGKGTVYLYNGDSKTNVGGFTERAAAKYEYFTVNTYGAKDNHNLTSTKKYKLVQIASRNVSANNIKATQTFTFKSDEVEIPAYPQVSEVSSDFDSNSKKLTFKWSVPSVTTTNVDTSGFVFSVTKTLLGKNGKDSVSTTTSGRTSYNRTTPNYSHVVSLASGEKARFKFHVERAATASSALICYGKTYGKDVEVTISTEHCYPINPSATLSSDDSKVDIVWGTSGSVWSAGTEMIIRKTNLVASSYSDIVLDEKAYKSGHYVDDLISPCNNYSYALILAPGVSGYEKRTIDVEGVIEPRRQGTVKNLVISKGYYSEKVDLDWETTSAFDEIVIDRREYNNVNSSFKKIQSITSTSASSEYSIEDRTCQPGIMYEYRVYGLSNCAGKLITSEDTITGIGFRTPTGNFYGRVTFENGQGVDSVDVRLETEDETSSNALSFNGNGTATIPGDKVLVSADAISIQAWVKPVIDSIAGNSMSIVSKGKSLDLGLIDGSVYFKLGQDTFITNKKVADVQFTHVSAVLSKPTLQIYYNGELILKDSVNNLIYEPESDNVIFGKDYKGVIDEVRLWSRALEANEIFKDYTRYLTGNESGLDAYYTFDYLLPNEFYDCSSTKRVFHANTGKLKNVEIVESKLSNDQLSYKGYTNVDGTYSINAVPYFGEGTSYTIIPRKGTHQFSPKQEIRFVGADAQSHTVNFTDNSSFAVSGTIYYAGGTYPVEGVHFTIDGAIALNKSGQYIMTDADGNFTINVPVGTHEVKAVKDGHTFELDGRICNSDGSDRNYQDVVTGLKLYDNTKIKYIGRICGGEVQESFPVGFSLSKNNLANDMKIVLKPTQTNRELQSVAHVETVSHPVLKGTLARAPKTNAKETTVEYNTDNITIHVNNETGEFIAWVYPIDYTISLSVYGHEGISGDNSSLNLSAYKIEQFEKYEYVDSVYTNGINDKEGFTKVSYVDSIGYIQKQVFTKRYTAQMEVTQVTGADKSLPYFGDTVAYSDNMLGETEKIQLWSESNGYSLKYPVFSTGSNYRFKYEVFEEYPFYISSKKDIDSSKIDRVMVEPTEVLFNNKMAISDSVDTEKSIYMFKVTEPSISSATGTIAATFTYGTSDNPTSVAWENPIGNSNGMAYILGAHQTGTNFVTAGPDKLLCVLRDPPGSNSYSYLEKGVTFSEESKYTGSVKNEGNEDFTTGVEVRTQQITVVGVGTMVGTATTLAEVESGVTLGISHSEEYTGNNSSKTSVTTTTRFQTSDDPLYVGANGDLYIGYSTNITFGTSQNVKAVSRATYDSLGGESAYEKTYLVNDNMAVVQSNGVTMGQKFGTLFAYPQVHIEQVLIPTLEELRNSLLLLPSEADSSTLQAKANADSVNYYYSLVNADDANFGEPDYYVPYLSQSLEYTRDTIEALNTYIKDWKKALSDNDSVKATVIKDEKLKLQNYSFQAGGNVEYSEQYSSTLTSNHSFSITIGGKVSNDTYLGTTGAKTKFEFEETVETSQGGEFENELEASHAKGFVLAEDGDDDYLSVDVFHDSEKTDETYEQNGVNSGSVDKNSLKKKDSYSTFVFSTKGGATGCPYEGAYTASHWKGHETEVISAATMKLENPKIDMPTKFVENVPSGEDAYLTVYLKNDSETGEDQWFDLRFVDATNPYGAVPSIDGNSMSGFALEYLVPAGQVLEKTLAVTKGSVLNYDNMAIALCSKCQADPTDFLDVISDTVYFSVHFIPSCSNVTIAKPSNNWTYNTNCSVDTIDGVAKHYMPITISGFDVNYTDFEHIELQYKPASGSDNDWLTLAYYYKEDSLAKNAVANGLNAFAISSTDGGNIYYNFYMDNLPDQKYDLRAVSFCNINNELYDNPSEVVSGIKDMYNPRLFGTPKPADGVLTVNDDIRIDFNETIAEGMLTANNFEVTGVRNGAVSDHSVAIALDGVNDYLVTEATRNFAKKDLTFECWVNFDSLQNATFFSHGSANEAISMGMNNNGNVVVKVGSKEITSEKVPAWEKSSWNHVALVYDNVDTTVTAYVNYVSVIDGQKVGAYNGNGVVEIGRNVATQSGNFNGKVDQFRVWNAVRSSATIQANSATQLSGNDLGLIAYYAMDEAKGNATEDKARGANLIMKGGSWALPEGRSAAFDGTDYVALNSSAAVIPSDMDFTLEFWFNAESGAKNQTIISNGNGIDNVGEDPAKLFSVGFNENGVLSFNHNGFSTLVDGNYADNNWHNFTLSVSRSSGTARIYMDGQLNTYFSNDKVDRIASDKLYAGARVWHKEKSVTKTVDQYFTGKVDEIRLWNLYRQQSQIESFYNQKSNGDEMGLLLYYPFEHYIDWQGTKEMQFTLNNIVNNDTTSVAVGKVNGVTNIPPVKSKGAVSSLLYDWVVNNDALIITLKEQDYRIEKTIVNVTVNKVQDVNGNYILSPITLSAYIDRNQLKWMDDAVTIEKKEGESYKFEMPIVNNGGSVINYRLNNMPSWLSASSESGVIKPLEKQTVKFEIDPSLAVGSYNEVVYLTNSNNVTEPLALNVTVEGSTPDWNVDPSKYEFNMAVFAQIKVDGQFSNDEKDMLAAFYQGECVGKANISYDKTLDMWYALMTVYSPVSRSHNVEYRIWDASKGLMSRAAASVSANFVNNSVLGKPDQPIVFSNDSLKYQNIQLNKGWNWVSFNLKSENMSDMDAYLANGNWAANSFVKNKNKSANYSSSLKTWVNEGVSLNNTGMFKIYSEYDQTLFVSGSDIDLASTELTVNGKSWNYISYLPAYSMSVKEALADYEATEGDVIKSNDGFAMYYGNNWIGSLKNMLPNSGYMLKNAGATKTFKYPTALSSLRSATALEATASDYEMNMNIIAYVPEKQDGDVVRAIVGNVENEVVEVELTDDYALQFINIAANAGDNIRFTLEHDGVTYVASNQLSFVGDEVCGSPKSPVILTFNVDGIGDALTVYPNPVDDELNIKGVVDNNEDVSIEIFDLTGKLVYSSTVTVSDYTLEALVNMTDFTSGSYMLKVTQNGESNTFKIVKK